MQTWTGIFTWNNQCQSNYCCCYAGKLTVTQSDSNLIFSSDTKGCATSTSTATFPNPNGYSFSTIGTRGTQIIYTLSSDSNTITVRNSVYSYCEGAATRSSAEMHVYPSTISFVIVLASIWIML